MERSPLPRCLDRELSLLIGSGKDRSFIYMNSFRSSNYIGKTCALLTATLILTALAHAREHSDENDIDHRLWGDWDKGNAREDHDWSRGLGSHQK